MKLESMKCPMCGATVNAENGISLAECPACGSEYFVDAGKKIADIDETIANRLKNLRAIQAVAVQANDIGSTSKSSYDILEIVAGDGLSQYYYAYAENVLGHNAYINEYYDNGDVQLTPSGKRRVLSHIYEYSDLRDRLDVEKYIMALEGVDNSAELRLYKAQYATRRALEENYDDIPRDIFVCHRSTDKQVAVSVVRELEEDSHTCWISTRNLRPNDTVNYWENIRSAIKSCSLFLVISSEDAMMSKDVKSEINIAKSLKKDRLEYKIDASTHTSLFNSFFDGNAWVVGVGNTKKQLADLCIRAFREIDAGNQKNSKINSDYGVTGSVAKETNDVATLLYEAEKKLKTLNFVAAKSILDSIEVQKYDCAEMWWMKFLASHRIADDKEVAREIADYTSDKNYINAINLATDQEQKIIWMGLVDRAKDNLYKTKIAATTASQGYNGGESGFEHTINGVVGSVLDTGKAVANNMKKAFAGSTPSYYNDNPNNTFANTSANKRKGISRNWIALIVLILIVLVPVIITMAVFIPKYFSDIGKSQTDQTEETVVTMKGVDYQLKSYYYEVSDINNSTKIEIVKNIKGVPVYFTENDLFTYNTKIQEVVIDAKIIEYPIFEACFDLTKVTGEGFDGWNEIPKNAYNMCRSLVSVKVSANLVSIGESAFEECENMETFVIGSSVVSIGKSAFEDCNSLSLYMPNHMSTYNLGKGWNKFILATYWV